MPSLCLARPAILAAARELVWWPSFAKLEPVLLKAAAPLQAERRRLAVVVAAASRDSPAPFLPWPGRPGRTAEEIAAVHAAAAARAQEVPAGNPRKAPVRGKPACLQHADLVEQYRRIAEEGGQLAALARTRLAALDPDCLTVSRENETMRRDNETTADSRVRDRV